MAQRSTLQQLSGFTTSPKATAGQSLGKIITQELGAITQEISKQNQLQEQRDQKLSTTILNDMKIDYARRKADFDFIDPSNPTGSEYAQFLSEVRNNQSKNYELLTDVDKSKYDLFHAGEDFKTSAYQTVEARKKSLQVFSEYLIAEDWGTATNGELEETISAYGLNFLGKDKIYTAIAKNWENNLIKASLAGDLDGKTNEEIVNTYLGSIYKDVIKDPSILNPVNKILSRVASNNKELFVKQGILEQIHSGKPLNLIQGDNKVKNEMYEYSVNTLVASGNNEDAIKIANANGKKISSFDDGYNMAMRNVEQNPALSIGHYNSWVSTKAIYAHPSKVDDQWRKLELLAQTQGYNLQETEGMRNVFTKLANPVEIQTVTTKTTSTGATVSNAITINDLNPPSGPQFTFGDVLPKVPNVITPIVDLVSGDSQVDNWLPTASEVVGIFSGTDEQAMAAGKQWIVDRANELLPYYSGDKTQAIDAAKTYYKSLFTGHKQPTGLISPEDGDEVMNNLENFFSPSGEDNLVIEYSPQTNMWNVHINDTSSVLYSTDEMKQFNIKQKQIQTTVSTLDDMLYEANLKLIGEKPTETKERLSADNEAKIMSSIDAKLNEYIDENKLSFNKNQKDTIKALIMNEQRDRILGKRSERRTFELLQDAGDIGIDTLNYLSDVATKVVSKFSNDPINNIEGMPNAHIPVGTNKKGQKIQGGLTIGGLDLQHSSPEFIKEVIDGANLSEHEEVALQYAQDVYSNNKLSIAEKNEKLRNAFQPGTLQKIRDSLTSFKTRDLFEREGSKFNNHDIDTAFDLYLRHLTHKQWSSLAGMNIKSNLITYYILDSSIQNPGDFIDMLGSMVKSNKMNQVDKQVYEHYYRLFMDDVYEYQKNSGTLGVKKTEFMKSAIKDVQERVDSYTGSKKSSKKETVSYPSNLMEVK